MALSTYEEIVGYFSTPTLVLAGPGTGKTYLLADRITRLLKNGADKEAITVLTYTTDANQNMINTLTDPNGHFKLNFSELPHISTMHSLGLSIVQEDPHGVNLLKTDLKVQADEKIKRLIYRDAALIIGTTEETSIEARECKQYGDCRMDPDKEPCKICLKYWEIMSKCNRIDFDDQILFACQILDRSPEILEKYQSQAEHLLVDEYQDINTAQFTLIELMSRRRRNGLFVVGDDAQSIYGFRGGDPKFILHFKDDFPDSEIAHLSISRRCHENIMNDAFTVLEKYYTDWSGRPKLQFTTEGGDEAHIYHLPSEITEAKMVANIAKSAILEKKDVLVLAPKKGFFPLIISELSKRGLYSDCQLSFLPGRIEIADRFIRWAEAPSNTFLTRLILEDLINIGIAKVPGANKKKLKNQKSLDIRIREEREIARLWELVNRDTDLFSVVQQVEKPNATIVKIRNGLDSLLSTYSDYSKDPGEFAKQLSCVSGIWSDPIKLSDDIAEVVKLLDSENTVMTGTVQLRTMRKAKGLQAKVVIIVGLENDIIPERDTDSDIVEQARLFYVSLTRAREELYLFHSYRRPRNISYGPKWTKKQRSEFLDALERESEWKKFK